MAKEKDDPPLPPILGSPEAFPVLEIAHLRQEAYSAETASVLEESLAANQADEADEADELEEQAGDFIEFLPRGTDISDVPAYKRGTSPAILDITVRKLDGQPVREIPHLWTLMASHLDEVNGEITSLQDVMTVLAAMRTAVVEEGGEELWDRRKGILASMLLNAIEGQEERFPECGMWDVWMHNGVRDELVDQIKRASIDDLEYMKERATMAKDTVLQGETYQKILKALKFDLHTIAESAYREAVRNWKQEQPKLSLRRWTTKDNQIRKILDGDGGEGHFGEEVKREIREGIETALVSEIRNLNNDSRLEEDLSEEEFPYLRRLIDWIGGMVNFREIIRRGLTPKKIDPLMGRLTAQLEPKYQRKGFERLQAECIELFPGEESRALLVRLATPEATKEELRQLIAANPAVAEILNPEPSTFACFAEINPAKLGE